MESKFKFIRRLSNTLLEALFPVKCLACGCFFDPPDVTPWQRLSRELQAGQAFDVQQHAIIALFFSRYLCAGCAQGIVPVEAPMCLSCGIMFKSRQGEDRTCEDCITAPGQFRIARAPVVYDQALMNLIHCFKYDGKIQLAKPLAGLMLTAFQRYWDVDSFDIVMPVPLYDDRMKQRGFNQAFVLIYHWEKIAAELELDFPKLQIEKSSLVRNRPTASQTGLGRTERMENMKNAFSVREPGNIREKRILLVDDVYTTGATVNECVRVLSETGAEYVDVLTVARAM
jgi:ComF family protein